MIERPLNTLARAVASQFETASVNKAVLVLMLTAFVAGVTGPSMHEMLPWDTMESFIWGRSFQLGYSKHGPLVAWIAGATERAAPGQWWLVFVWAQLCVAATMFAVWRLGSALLGPQLGGLSAILTLAGVYCYTEPSATLTPDQLSMPMWALAVLFYWRAVGEKRTNYWYALGLVIAVALYAKYVISLLVVVLGLLTVFTQEGRHALRAPAPWLAALLGLAAITPHLTWLLEHPSPLTHPLERPAAASPLFRVWFTFKFLIAQLLNHVPLALLLALLLVPSDDPPQVVVERSPLNGFARRFIVAVGVLPLGSVLLFNLWAGVEFRHGWGLPLFPASAILVIALLDSEVKLRRLATAASFSILFVVVPHLGNGLLPWLASTPKTGSLPGKEAARLLTAEYRNHTGQRLSIFVGDRFYGGAVAVYSPDRPLLLIDGRYDAAPWVTPDILRTKGALVVWRNNHRHSTNFGTGPISKTFIARGEIVLPWAAETLSLGWGILPEKH